MKPGLMQHPARAAIVTAVVTAPGARSPKELADELGMTLGSTAYHVRALAEAGVLVKAREKQVRGAVAHYYRPSTRVRVRRELIEVLADLEATAHRARMALEAKP